MKLYHGTNIKSAKSILGPPNNIDVKLGSGELGRGFYAGNELTLAQVLAVGKHRDQAAIIKIKIDDSEILNLKTKALLHRSDVILETIPILKFANPKNHLFQYDLVSAPFATIEHSVQYKFESLKAQNVLNASKLKQIYPK